MSRWIDAEAVESTLQEMEIITAMSHIELGEEGDDIGEISMPMFTVRNIMKTAPSIDIVRCRECWHSKKIECEDGVFEYFCDISDLKWRADDFCSYGERESDE